MKGAKQCAQDLLTWQWSDSMTGILQFRTWRHDDHHAYGMILSQGQTQGSARGGGGKEPVP